jgi:hypothetical protein
MRRSFAYAQDDALVSFFVAMTKKVTIIKEKIFRGIAFLRLIRKNI